MSYGPGRLPEELVARLAYVDFDGAAALAAAEAAGDGPLDDAFVEAHCPRVAQAVQRFAAWVAG